MAFLFPLMAKNSIKKELLYNRGMLLGGVFLLMGYFADALMIAVLFSKVGSIGGWDVCQITFMYGINTFAYTVTASVFAFCAVFSDEVVYGGLDQVLVLPVNNLKYYIYNGVNLTYLSRSILCFAIVVISIGYSGVSISIGLVSYLIVTIIGAVLIQSAFFLAFAIPNFYFVKAGSFRAIFMGIRFFCNYPLSIYPYAVRWFLTYICPLGFVSYYPALYIFNKTELASPPGAGWLTLPIGIILFAISTLLWKKSTKHYRSTGS